MFFKLDKILSLIFRIKIMRNYVQPIRKIHMPKVSLYFRIICIYSLSELSSMCVYVYMCAVHLNVTFMC